MQNLWSLALWLALSTVYLLDTVVLMSVLGPWTSPAVRQGWMAAPLAFAFLALLATPWAPWAVAFLLFALALHLAAHLLGQRRVGAGLAETPAELVQQVRDLAIGWGINPPDRVAIDPADRLEPGVMGLWRPMLILPTSALALPAEEFRAVIAHELAHLQARDPLKLWLTSFARTLLGWHPTAARLAGAIALEVELEADRRASAWVGDREGYALTLGRWGLRRAEPSVPRFGVALTGTSSQLMLRLRSLLNPHAPPPHLEIPAWVPGSERARRNRAAGKAPRRPPTESYVGRLPLVLSAGYLALFLLLIRLV